MDDYHPFSSVRLPSNAIAIPNMQHQLIQNLHRWKLLIYIANTVHIFSQKRHYLIERTPDNNKSNSNNATTKAKKKTSKNNNNDNNNKKKMECKQQHR